jgi:DNA-binding NarL/FixJ family response regulator
VSGAAEELERGRDAYSSRAWSDAYEAFSNADRALRLAAGDLNALATSAYMLGRDEDYVRVLERAFGLHRDAGEPVEAVRCAFWIGLTLLLRGETGRASGWLGRALRVLDRAGGEGVERGYLQLPLMFRHEAAGDLRAATAVAAEAAATGERFGDPDLFALASHSQGVFLVKQGRAPEGLALMDEAMLAVTAGELSPIASGLVYCGVIGGCQEAYEPRRAQEWTAALTQWCELQPDMVAFTGRCLTHRAEILCLHGAWREALDEAQRASRRCEQGQNASAGAEAMYLQGEVHRLRGEFDAAEEAYREASRSGREPQPGLALLRLAQDRGAVAAAAIRRAVDEAREQPQRARLLPAYVEIMLAAGDGEAARAGCTELQRIADDLASDMLAAMAAQARGAVDLATGDPHVALVALRRAADLWQQLEAPYEVARTRALIGAACAALGDDEAAALELDAARGAFAALGTKPSARAEAAGLTVRELQVLRLVAVGKTNREIASELVVSEHTIARHLQNIFAKLGVSSRTAAGAFAFSHDLVRGQN